MPDFGEEALLADGDLTGSLHGLLPKSERAAAEGVFFRQQLGKLDWSELRTPPVLVDAGVVGGKRGQGVDEASHDTSSSVAGGRSSSLQLEASGPEEGRGGGGRGRGDGWGWGEGVVAGVAGGVIASACVVVLGGTIKRGMRGGRSYEDISGGANAW